jgi:hypothetical protein
LEDLGIDGKITLKWMKEIEWEHGNWITVVQDRVQNWALVNMNICLFF